MRAHQEHFEQIRNAELAEAQVRLLSTLSSEPRALTRLPSTGSGSRRLSVGGKRRRRRGSRRKSSGWSVRRLCRPRSPRARLAKASGDHVQLPSPRCTRPTARKWHVHDVLGTPTGLLAELQSAVTQSLTESGFFYDPLEAEVREQFVPWLLDAMDDCVNQARARPPPAGPTRREHKRASAVGASGARHCRRPHYGGQQPRAGTVGRGGEAGEGMGGGQAGGAGQIGSASKGGCRGCCGSSRSLRSCRGRWERRGGGGGGGVKLRHSHLHE